MNESIKKLFRTRAEVRMAAATKNAVYYVSEYGDVYSMKVTRLTPHPNPARGYNTVMISDKRIPIHRMVATAFIPNPDNKREVNHINGIKTDNRVTNLEWATPSENMRHAIKTGLIKPNRNPKLYSLEIIEDMANDIISGITFREAGAKYGISYSTIAVGLMKLRRGIPSYWDNLPEKLRNKLKEEFNGDKRKHSTGSKGGARRG